MPRTTAIQNAKKQTHPSPAPANRPERPHKGLTATQEELAELATDILLNGGARTDVDLFLKALDRHRYRRFVGRMGTVDKSETEIDEKSGRSLEYWYGDLAKDWPDNKPAKRRREPVTNLKTVSEIARANVRRDLRYQFDEFMGQMEGIESAYVLNESLEYTTCGGEDMAHAFSRFFEDDKTYVRIPCGIEEEVRNFITLLEKRAA